MANKAEKAYMLSQIPTALGKAILADYPESANYSALRNVENLSQAGLLNEAQKKEAKKAKKEAKKKKIVKGVTTAAGLVAGLATGGALLGPALAGSLGVGATLGTVAGAGLGGSIGSSLGGGLGDLVTGNPEGASAQLAQAGQTGTTALLAGALGKPSANMSGNLAAKKGVVLGLDQQSIQPLTPSIYY